MSDDKPKRSLHKTTMKPVREPVFPPVVETAAPLPEGVDGRSKEARAGASARRLKQRQEVLARREKKAQERLARKRAWHASRGTMPLEDKKALEEAMSAPGGALLINTMSQQQLAEERNVLTAALIEEKRELGKADFWFFLTQCLFPKVWQQHYADPFHRDICGEIQTLSPGQNLWLFVFRSARKSYIMNLARHVWMIVRDPNIRLLLVGAREETVRPFARWILSAFLRGSPGFEDFHAIFSDYVIDKKGREVQQAFQFTHPLRTSPLTDPTFRAAYLGVTGAGFRCDEITYDDPIERRNVRTPEQSAKSLQQMLDLIPLVDSGSPYRRIFGAGTPRVFHEPYARIRGDMEAAMLEGGGADAFATLRDRSKTHVMVRHALEHPTRPCSDCPDAVLKEYPHNAFDLEEGIPPSFPVHTREMILEKYNEYLLDPEKGESAFYHEYGVVYRSPKDQKFQEEWFITAGFPNYPSPKLRVLCLDGADKDFQQENTGDAMCALFGEFDDWGRLLLVHGLWSRAWTRAEFVDRIRLYCRAARWWPDKVVKQKYGEGGATLLTDIKRSFEEDYKVSHFMAVTRPEGVGQILKKYDFITGMLQAPMQKGECVFGSAFPRDLFEKAKYETVNLGRSRRDDVPDTLSLFFMPGVRLENAPQKGIAPESWAPPPLDLYGMPATPQFAALGGPADPFQQALQGQRFNVVIEELGGNWTANRVDYPPPTDPKITW